MADITTALLAWWKFDEGTGTTAIDSSGNNNTGTFINGAGYTTGKIGPFAMITNGTTNTSGNHVSVPDTVALNLQSTDFTIAMWIKPVVNNWAANYTSIISKRNPGVADTYEIYLTNAVGQLGFYNGSLFTTFFQPSVGVWTHIAVVESSGTLSFYINGLFLTSVSATIGPVSTGASTLIGDYDGTGSDQQQFNGSMDDVRIYTRALSQADITMLYNYTGTFTANQRTLTGVGI